MASQTQGIQQLLAAEKKAADKVAEARKRKWNSLSRNFWKIRNRQKIKISDVT
jgi:Vacuolar (H+)-ATPase G subunit